MSDSYFPSLVKSSMKEERRRGKEEERGRERKKKKEEKREEKREDRREKEREERVTQKYFYVSKPHSCHRLQTGAKKNYPSRSGEGKSRQEFTNK